MPTLQESIDQLDRMIDTGADIPKTRSQLAFIGREVSALEADYSSLAQSHSQLQQTHTELVSKINEMKERDKKELSDWMTQRAKEHSEVLRSKRLNHNF
jgi:uncharacterized protein (DUF3084 family)